MSMFSKLITTGLLSVACLVNATAVLAEYPTKPIKLMVAYRAGGGADSLARQLVSTIEQQQGWKFVVQNATGAEGSVMATKLKLAKPDGYTLGFAVSAAFYLNPLLNEKSRYQADDFTYIAALSKLQMAVVALAERGWQDLDAMAAFAKENGPLSIALQGQELELITDQIGKHYGIEFKKVPTKGGAGSIQQIMGQHIDLGMIAGAHVKYVESGELSELAVLTAERTEQSPETKTLRDHGIDTSMNNYFQIQGPKGMPEDVVQTLFAAIEQAVQSPEMQELIVNRMHMSPEFLGPDELQAFILKTTEQRKAELAAQ